MTYAIAPNVVHNGSVLYFYMKIRRTEYYSKIRNPRISKDYIKSLAMFCYLKESFKASVVPNYTIDKIHNVTRLHRKTVEKRVKLLLQLGYVEIVTTAKGDVQLKLNKVAARHDNRNIDLNCVVLDSVKTIEKSLYAVYLGEIQKHKDYVRQTIYEAHNSCNLGKLKDAKKRGRGYDDKFVDNGLSYKGIAKRLNCSIQKAWEIVRFAVEYDFIVKIKRQYQMFCRDAKRRFNYCKNDVLKFMFATKNNLYCILANRYALGSRLQSQLDIIR